jgi:hypothetical protein
MTPRLLDLLARLCLIAALGLLLVSAGRVVRHYPGLALLLLAGACFEAYHGRRLLPRLSRVHGQARWGGYAEALAARMFERRGLFLGRLRPPSDSRFQAALRLLTLPVRRSALAVRQFGAAFTRRSRGERP